MSTRNFNPGDRVYVLGDEHGAGFHALVIAITPDGYFKVWRGDGHADATADTPEHRAHGLVQDIDAARLREP